MQFGDDWPGIFIRGDHALMGFAHPLRLLLNGDSTEITLLQVRHLLHLLESCNARANDPERQVLQPFEQCRAEPGR